MRSQQDGGRRYDQLLGGDGNLVADLRKLAMLALPGIPAIWQGTEQGFREQRAAMFAGGFGSGGRDHFDTQAPLFRFLQRALGHHAQAEECFQEVWSRVIQARARYRPEAKFTTWLYQIAHNLVVDLHRRQRPEVSSEDAPAAASAVHRAEQL